MVQTHSLTCLQFGNDALVPWRSLPNTLPNGCGVTQVATAIRKFEHVNVLANEEEVVHSLVHESALLHACCLVHVRLGPYGEIGTGMLRLEHS